MQDFSQLASQALILSAPKAPATPLDAIGNAIGDKLFAGIELGGTGIALAYLNSRSPSEGKSYHESFGYPTDAMVAFGGIILGLLMGSSHALRIGIGALVETGARYGMQQGKVDRQKAMALLTGKTEMKVISGGKTESALAKPSEQAFEKAR